MSGFLNRPRVLKGAFVEFGLSLPPLAVKFQFNPVQLQRSRHLSFRAPNDVYSRPPGDQGARDGHGGRLERPRELRDWHAESADLDEIRRGQIVSVQEETLAFDLRLDATDDLNDGDPIAEGFGIAPALSTLELMTCPKGEGPLAGAIASLLGPPKDYQFAGSENPPMVLFVWGVQRVLPVNITSLTITESEFDAMLNPIRATVGVTLTVIEGQNPIARYSTAAKEAMSLLNAGHAVAEITIPA